MNCLQSWPEPIVRVQSLSESGIRVIPERYIKRAPSIKLSPLEFPENKVDIPVIDLSNLYSNDVSVQLSTLNLISTACSDWGFFQVVNHGVDHQLMAQTREIWREFFHQPVEVKQAYANSPITYEGYGSRLGVEKGAKLDWNDYFFLHYLPTAVRDEKKWPSLPESLREIVAKYSEELVKVTEKLMKVLSINLGLEESYLQQALGGHDQVGASLRVNFYPKCPQPDLALGLSPHSDPGALTLLLPDENVSGLQVRRGDDWITVNPLPNAFIVNIGDQIQILSNAKYKSVEHQVIVNSSAERVSLAFFYNPKGDLLIEPAKELVNEDEPAVYLPMTFNEYRLAIRTKGPCGKSSLEALKSPRSS